MHFFTSAKANQLICELMSGNLDRILIRRAGCLILSTVFTEDLMVYALVTYSNFNESFVLVLFFFFPFHFFKVSVLELSSEANYHQWKKNLFFQHFG